MTGWLPTRAARAALWVVLLVGAPASGVAGDDALTLLLQEELSAALPLLSSAEAPVHHAMLAVRATVERDLAASDGAPAWDRREDVRRLDVDVRVGSPAQDSTHALRGLSALEDAARTPALLPVADGEDAIRRALRQGLDEAAREGRERLRLVAAEARVRVAETDASPDWSAAPPDPPGLVVAAPAPLDLEALSAWQPAIVAASARLAASPGVLVDRVQLVATTETVTHVAGGMRDGAVRLEPARRHGRTHARVAVYAVGRAADGADVDVFRSVDVASIDRLPAPDALLPLADEVAAELAALLEAPVASPSTGPVLLSGRAAAVFVHEVIGHRVESHRQRSDEEGQTFRELVGEPVLPRWVSIHDDPTLTAWEGVDLNGHYVVDDEGVAARRAPIVRDGLFEGFLLTRTPIAGFPESNGHARRSPGRAPVARMGVTVLEASRTTSDAGLRARLLRLARAQGRDHAYIVEEIDGGFTLTGRVLPNAFNVRATRTRRVYVDGRPDELVRGIDLVGTPLAAFRNLVAAGASPAVFNGVCGAESGWVPVSAVSPALLFERLEFQLKEKGSRTPPLLPPPRPPPGEVVP